MVTDYTDLMRQATANEVRRWPIVDAQVINSKVSEVDASTETNFATRLSVAARFSFVVEKQSKEAEYSATWHRADYRDWSKLLAPGSLLKIRVDASDPSRISLIDYNGLP